MNMVLVKWQFLRLLDSSKLISRKISVAEKVLNFHTVNPQWAFQHEKYSHSQFNAAAQFDWLKVRSISLDYE